MQPAEIKQSFFCESKSPWLIQGLPKFEHKRKPPEWASAKAGDWMEGNKGRKCGPASWVDGHGTGMPRPTALVHPLWRCMAASCLLAPSPSAHRWWDKNSYAKASQGKCKHKDVSLPSGHPSPLYCVMCFCIMHGPDLPRQKYLLNHMEQHSPSTTRITP